MHLIQMLLIRRDKLTYRTLCFLDRIRRKAPIRLTTVRVTGFPHPDTIDKNSLLITQIGRRRKWASLRCPGNFGKIVRLRLASSESPHWSVKIDWLGRATIAPSVRQLTSCECHFWIRRGCIQWCVDTPVNRRSPKISSIDTIVQNGDSSA